MENMHQAGTCTFELSFKIIMSSFFVVVLVLSCFENSLVCLAVIRRKELRTPANVLIVSLSLSDIIIGLTVPTMEMIYIIAQPKWPLRSIGTSVQSSFWLFSVCMPFVTLTVITFDRYRAVTSFSRYKDHVTLKSSLLMVLGIWLYSIAVVALMASFFDQAPNDYYEWNVKESWYYPFLIIHVAVPFFVILALYFHIYKATRLSRAQVTTRSAAVPSVRTEYKLAKTVGIIIALLLLVWLPVFCLEVVYALDSDSCLVSKLGSVSVLITCCNGVINPWVYWRRSVDFRKAFIDMLSVTKCCVIARKEKPMEDVSTGTSI